MIRENVITLLNHLYIQHRQDARRYKEAIQKISDPSTTQYLTELALSREKMASSMLEQLNRLPAAQLPNARRSSLLQEQKAAWDLALQRDDASSIHELCWKNERNFIRILENSLHQKGWTRNTRILLEEQLLQSRHHLLWSGQHVPAYQLDKSLQDPRVW